MEAEEEAQSPTAPLPAVDEDMEGNISDEVMRSNTGSDHSSNKSVE